MLSKFVRHLGILQSGKGSGEDWTAEGAKMRYVYSSCQVNISTSCANHPEDSFFVARDASLLRPLLVQAGNVVMELKVEGSQALKFELAISPLTKRAWIFQERILSPRILSFGRHQLFW
jgi:hypothetical protein